MGPPIFADGPSAGRLAKPTSALLALMGIGLDSFREVGEGLSARVRAAWIERPRASDRSIVASHGNSTSRLARRPLLSVSFLPGSSLLGGQDSRPDPDAGKASSVSNVAPEGNPDKSTG